MRRADCGELLPRLSFDTGWLLPDPTGQPTYLLRNPAPSGALLFGQFRNVLWYLAEYARKDAAAFEIHVDHFMRRRRRKPLIKPHPPHKPLLRMRLTKPWEGRHSRA